MKQISFTLLLLLGLASYHADAQSSYTPPWTLGDETTVACFTIVPEGQEPTYVNVTGVDIQYIIPLGNPLTVGTPINASVEVKVDPIFFTGNTNLTNNYTISPDPSSLAFSELCLQPLGTGTNTCAAPVSATNCCIWHMNWHFCPNNIVSSQNCLPWVNATTTTSGQSVLLTGSPAQTGLLNTIFQSDTFALTNVSSTDMYTVLAHFRMANIQCAIGANRRVVFGTTTTSTTSATSNSTVVPTIVESNNNNQAAIIGGSVGGGIAVAAIAVVAFLCVRRKSNNTQNLNNNKNDMMRQSMVYNNEPAHRPYSEIIPSGSGHPSTIGGNSPIPSEAHYTPNLTAPYSASQHELSHPVSPISVSPVAFPPQGMQYVVPDVHGAYSHPPGTYYIPVTYPQGIPMQPSSYMTNSPPPSSSAMSVPGFGFPMQDNRSMGANEEKEMQKPNHDGFLIASPRTISSSTTSHSSAHDQQTGPYGQLENQ